MKKYVEDHVDFGNIDSNEIEKHIEKLKNEGWKNISFYNWHTEIDGGVFIEGLRPYTKRELKSIENKKKLELKKELNLLKKLAKKFEYKLVKDNA